MASSSAAVNLSVQLAVARAPASLEASPPQSDMVWSASSICASHLEHFASSGTNFTPPRLISTSIPKIGKGFPHSSLWEAIESLPRRQRTSLMNNEQTDSRLRRGATQLTGTEQIYPWLVFQTRFCRRRRSHQQTCPRSATLAYMALMGTTGRRHTRLSTGRCKILLAIAFSSSPGRKQRSQRRRT